SNPMNDPIRATGCDSRRHSQSGSPIKASNARAATTTKSVSLQINTSMRHALELRGEAIERLRQPRAAAHGQLFRNHKALRGWVEVLQRRMQHESPAFVFGKVASFGYQQEIGLQADDRFERSEAAELVTKIGRRIVE